MNLARKQLEGNREEYDDNLERLRGALAENEKKIAAQLSDLSIAEGTAAKGYIIKIIDELHGEGEIIRSRIAEMESLAANHILSNIEFDIIRQMLGAFKDTMDDMSVEQKRAALRTFVKKVVWDGENVHVYLFGSDDSGGIELPPEEFHQANGELTEADEYILEPLSENSK